MNINKVTVARFGLLGLATMAAFSPDPALAAGQGLPWESPLTTIQQSLSGTVVSSLAIISVVIAGLTYAFSEGGGLLRRSSGMVVGLSIAALAASFVEQLFGIGFGFAF